MPVRENYLDLALNIFLLTQFLLITSRRTEKQQLLIPTLISIVLCLHLDYNVNTFATDFSLLPLDISEIPNCLFMFKPKLSSNSPTEPDMWL